MAHCPFAKLADLSKELDSVRAWESVREPKPGIFYFKSKPFLHFHEKDGRRWADVRDGTEWGKPLEIPFAASSNARSKFLSDVKKRYLRMDTPPSRE